MSTADLRIGHGYDVHRFCDSFSPELAKPLVLAGVTVACERWLVAHSDGDVVIHALCDAMLGAIGAGDIGQHFPDTDAQYRDIDSAQLLQQVMAMAGKANWQVINADLTVVAQEPRLAAYIPAMRERLAKILQVSTDRLNIKATTTEGLGFVGRKEGIASYAVVLLGIASA